MASTDLISALLAITPMQTMSLAGLLILVIAALFACARALARDFVAFTPAQRKDLIRVIRAIRGLPLRSTSDE